MSRNISWINEIKNNTNEDYVIWCHDTDNEGEFKDYRTGKVIGRNDGGQQVKIRAGAHLAVSGCGIPDAGDKNEIPKARVICAVSALKHRKGDPGAGLRLNRVIKDDNENLDEIVYRNHGTTEKIASMIFPTGMEQNIILRIDPNGIFVDVKEAKNSSEWEAYLFGEKIKGLLMDLAPELAKLAIQAAQKTLEYLP